ncbi:MAG TPA: tripartite tricarboxylate transporter substrate binding protein [Ramlibacter sp.]|nr:tripartite tricarboxylate transporter substrate binding protein [Ramlibacter sp.]
MGSTLWPGIAGAQAAWPTRPLKIVDPNSPGGSTDVMARMIGSKLGPRLSQSVIVENKPGAGLALGTEAVAKAPPDGYTLLLSSTAQATNAAAGRKLSYDFMKDLVPIGQIGSTPLIIVVAADAPIKTMRDLIEQARAKRDVIRYSSSGIGSMSHIGMELLAAETKANLTHVPYRGVSLAIPDLLSGQVQCALGTVATYSSLLESGKLRALAVASPQRSPFLPNVPTTAEAGFPGYVIEFTWGLVGPRGIPADVVRRLNTELNAVLALPETREFLARTAAVPTPMTPEEYGRVNAFEVVRWTKLIKDLNIRVE